MRRALLALSLGLGAILAPSGVAGAALSVQMRSGAAPLPPRAAPTVVVRPGDTLSYIAQVVGESWQQLAAANHLADPSLIFPGQVLRLEPGKRSVTIPPVAVAAPAPTPAQTVAPASSTHLYSAAPSTGAPGSFQACVAYRESRDEPQVVNASGHYGLYQMSYTDWIAGGGSPADFGSASVAEQDAVFARLYAQYGTSPWAPYDGC